MFGLFNKQEGNGTNWLNLSDSDQLDKLIEESKQYPVAIFKHSTRCGISAMAKSRLESAGQEGMPPIYYLDLIANRPVSDAVAQRFGIRHESPQIIVIEGGEPVYNASHGGISAEDLKQYGV